jgi:small subunit ribosomal protein S16
MGKIRNPQYRIVVADSRKKRDGRAIENIGIYHPKEEPSRIQLDSERVQYWLSVGAQPSEPVLAILRKTGDWQKFKGLPAPSQALKAPPTRVDQHAVYQAEAKAAAGLADPAGKGEADQAPKKAAKKAGGRTTAKKAAPEAKDGQPKDAEAKPAKAAEAKPAKAGEAKPANDEAKAGEAKPAKDAEDRPAEDRPAEGKPAEDKPAADAAPAAGSGSDSSGQG